MYKSLFPECSNRFVKVEFNFPTITCKFLNQLDHSNKSCSVRYGRCSQKMAEIASATTTSDTIKLDINPSGFSNTICVTASNGSHIVTLEENVGKVLYITLLLL